MITAAEIRAMSTADKIAKIEGSLVKLADMPDSDAKRASVRIMETALVTLRRNLMEGK